jgi:nicotinamidase-related amidase
MTQALIIIDAQNEFSARGQRPVPGHADIIAVIGQRVEEARRKDYPIVWIRHFNKPEESPAFVPGTWGAELVDGFGPKPGADQEVIFQKNVYGAFTGTDIGRWLKDRKIVVVWIAGFYTHGCVSTTAREAIMADLTVYIDPACTGTCDMDHPLLGHQPATEVRRSALLQLANMGVNIGAGSF